MKTINILLALLFITSLNVFAQKIEIGFEVPIELSNSHIYKGNGVNFSFEYKLPELISFKSTLGGISAFTNGNELAKGNYSLFWAEETILLRKDFGFLQPYGGLGIGYYKTDININATERFAKNDQGIPEADNVQYKFSYNIRGGLDVMLSSRVILNAEVKYMELKPEVTHSYLDNSTSKITTVKNKINLSSYFLQLGLEVSI